MRAIETFEVVETGMDESTGFRYKFELKSPTGIYTHTHYCYDREDGIKALRELGFELIDDTNPAIDIHPPHA